MDAIASQQLQKPSVGGAVGGAVGGTSYANDSVTDLSDTDTLITEGARYSPDTCDKIDVILNKIDAELLSIQTKRSQGDLKQKKKLTKLERANLREQGVVFDTGDETNSERKLTIEDLVRLEELNSSSRAEKLVDGNDTGLGSFSVDEGLSDEGETRNSLQPLGRGQGKSRKTPDPAANKSRRSSASSSVLIAQHINAKFQRMMSSLDDYEAPQSMKEDQTDLESIRTEELETEFRKTLINQAGPAASLGRRSKVAHSTPTERTSSRQKRFSASSETDSIATENFDSRFQALLDHPHNSPMAPTPQRKFPSPKGGGDSVNSFVMEADFLISADDGKSEESDEVPDAFLENMIDGRFPELNHNSSAKFAQRPGSALSKDTTSTSLPRRVDSSCNENSLASLGNERIQNRIQTGVTQNGFPKGLASNESSVASERQFQQIQQIHLDDSLLDSSRSSRSLAELQNQRSTQFGRSVERPNAKTSQRSSPVPTALPSPMQNNSQLQNKIDLEVSLKLQEELKNLQTQIKLCIQAKQELRKEIALQQNMTAKYREEVKAIENQVKDSRVKAEDARSSLMLIEFERDSVQKQLDDLLHDFEEKEHRFKELENSGRKLQEIGFTAEEVTRIISDREELRERVKHLESLIGDQQTSTTELNLASMKEAIITEKKKYRKTLNALQRELELKQTTANELNSNREELAGKLKQLEKKLQEVEREKNEFMKAKSEESCTVEMQLKSELGCSREQAAALQRCLDEATDQLQIVKLEISRKEEQNHHLRDQVESAKNELTQERIIRDSVVEENMKSLKAVILDKEMTIEAVKAEAEKKMLEKYEQEQDLQNIEKHYAQQIAELQEQIVNRDLQLEALTARMREQEAWVNQLSVRIKEETYRKYHRILEEERTKLENDKEAEVAQKLRDVHNDMERSVRQLNEDLNHERTQCQNHQKQIFTLREELEDARYQFQQAAREKVELASKMEEMEQEKEHQLNLMTERHEMEIQRTMEKLHDTVSQQGDELERLRNEIKELRTKEEEENDKTEKYEQHIIEELDQEHHTIIQLLKAAATKFSNRTCYVWSPVKMNTRGSGTRAILTATLEGLRAASDELRQEVALLRTETEKHQHTMTKFERDKREEIEALKAKMQREKLQALETLKERLIHTRSYATGFIDVVNTQRMKEQRRRHLDWDQTRSPPSSQSSGSALYGNPVRSTRAGSLPSDENARTAAAQQLNEKMKQLQMETLTLQRTASLSSSVPNLVGAPEANPKTVDRMSQSALEREKLLKIRELELGLQREQTKTRLAEERASRNEQLFEQKSRDYSRIQDIYTQQAKELIQTQRAYSQLHNQCYSPTRSLIHSTVKSS